MTLRGRTILLCATLAACSGKGSGQPAPDARAEAARPPEDTGVRTFDLASTDRVALPDGAKLTVVRGGGEGSAAAAGAATVKMSRGETLPVEVGGELRVSPEVTIDAAAPGALLVFELPFPAGALPGGIERSGVHAAAFEGGAWRELPCVLAGSASAVIAAVPAAPGKIALLADARAVTPQAEPAEAAQALVALAGREKKRAGLLDGSGFAAAAPEEAQEAAVAPGDKKAREQSVVTYIGAAEAKIEIGGKVFVLKRAKGGTPLPFPYVVMDTAGAVMKSRAIVWRALLAQRLRELAGPAGLSAAVARVVGSRALVEERAAAACGGGGELARCLDLKSLGGAMDALAALVKENASGRNGDFFIGAYAGLVRIAAELDALRAEEAAADGSAAVAKESLARELVALLTAKETDGKKGKARRGGPPPGAGETAQEIFFALIGPETIAETVGKIMGSRLERAPLPDTKITGWKRTGETLLVQLKGSDGDGRVAAYAWWLDEPKVTSTLKGSAQVKLNLKTVQSGSHTLHVAGIDDDGQQDESPDRFTFYLRRVVTTTVKGVDASFEAAREDVNSEHVRAAWMFAREVEAEAELCTQDAFRFGIDGAGRIKVKATFGGSLAASAPSGREVLEDGYKNKALAGCILKALKAGKLRYNQRIKPPAEVRITFEFKPSVLFFDQKMTAGAPGPDITGAVRYKECTGSALKKIESFCRAALKNLPGPWDAAKLEELRLMKEAEEAAKKEEKKSADKGKKKGAKGKKDAAGKKKGQEEDLFAPPEFDPTEVMKDCVKESLKHLVAKCTAIATKKKSWCVDSCGKKTAQCEKDCKKDSGPGDDVNVCVEECWSDFMLSCATSCMYKDTPLEPRGPQPGDE